MATLMIIWLQKNGELQNIKKVVAAVCGGFVMDGILVYHLVQLATA